MKFKNKTTGTILTTNNEFVIEQLKSDDNYELVVEKKKEIKKIEVE